MEPHLLRTVLVTDCGSTTTKALLFERKEDRWYQTFRGEAPTTVEAPVADVTVGALNAFSEVEELSGRNILQEGLELPFIITEGDLTKGIDLYLSTSSAGGGLQMLVAGVVSTITTESAERAALGAGAIVMEAISADDGRQDFERIERIRHLKPDIVLVTGGVDGGSTKHVVEMAETLVAAAPRPRFGDTLKLPVIYAGNAAAAEEVRQILAKIAQVVVVDNVRPQLEREVLGPAREAIHEFFLSHVMSHSPGYGKLMSWSPVPIMPTPAAVGDIVQSYAQRTAQSVLCVDIGGATTDLFSVFPNRDGTSTFNRTVSANLGMSYSIANVLVEAGISQIKRWLPFEFTDTELADRLRNKMIRPTSIPQTIEELWIEQGVCREALRLSLAHHRSLAIGLEGRRERGISDIFRQSSERYELVDLMKLDIVIGSGGVLSHAPSRMQAALMMIDGFGLEGVTQLAVDSIFMMPHLGVFASVHPEGAYEVFENDCLVQLGCAVVPVFPSKLKRIERLAEIFLDGILLGSINCNEVTRFLTPARGEGSLKVVPLHRSIDIGAGAGQIHERRVVFGECGVIVDGRNRPLRPEALGVGAQERVLKNLGLKG
ncbi:MAG: glutamate mutase L [Proteobacteria bacterium]|nr:glutamate mutase L [Pseudomonadota bacterium]